MRSTATCQVTAWKRALFYTLGGIAGEIVFTGLKNYPNFQGHTQLWVVPMYWFGSLYVLEPLHDKIRNMPLLFRVALYAFTFFMIEYAGGWATEKLLGECPWKYESCLAVHGYINLAYFPLWCALGFMAEQVHNYFLRLKVDDFPQRT